MDIVSLKFDNFNIVVTINIVLLFLIIAFICFLFKLLFKSYYIDEINLGIGENTIKLKIDKSLKLIAHKILIELSTRVISYPFDDNDTIIEVYNSWYEAFKTIRLLLKDISIDKENAKKLSELTTELLNLIFRKHLTKWQAKFRKWYEYELAKSENNNLSPQEIQRKYVYYDDLVEDLKFSQMKIEKYIEELKKIIEL